MKGAVREAVREARKFAAWIVVRCSGTPSAVDIGMKELEEMQKAGGYEGAGLRFVIRRNGQIERGHRLAGDGGRVIISVCLVGGGDKDKKLEDNFTLAQRESLAWLLKGLKVRYPLAVVVGLNDLLWG